MSVATLESAPRAHQQFEIRPLGGPLGVEIVGLDLNLPVSDDELARIRGAFVKHGVAVFRDQRITPEQHIAFSRRFGPLQVHVLNRFHLKGHPEILIVSNVVEDGKPIGLVDAGADWHSDLSYMPKPSLGALLHSQELPAERGDTLYANTADAWDTLPAATRKLLEGKRAVHSYVYRYERLRKLSPWRAELTQQQIDEVPPVEHPVVITHPESGRRILFVSEGFTSHIVGIPLDESDALLKELHAHITRPENIYTHKWQPHDMVFWDNRSTQHYAAITPQHLRRTLYRTTVEGDVPR
ncbi:MULTISPECIES: TauD/TfdA family dioxygenase [unclassified Herbaspirillum]|uniref:TauD/TfdA dioxygenase family protein n=1 Tax=unclassified Herbaspirillum TaxID=2624150 RepID=UPI0011525639|nr:MULTISPECIES: TauD/TfdA family dioxygenase [unclassified Herbaspirillum]MBB5389921.1 taurine dioxygenase [Herbaspirillum sp. SJZ102]TQK09568.1 taurine dioxygenase [Herbaspirillum sp. SJZ130]TQK13745.1 taurine dioxygenase [Herbaspirillum sp. SJZ106]